MSTATYFYNEPLNHDYLMTITRPLFGDLTGAIYSDTMIRTAQVNAIRFLQRRWSSKYQIYDESLHVDPQPSDVPTGYILINTSHGTGYIPNTAVNGDVFRNAYLEFTQGSPPIIESNDEMAIALAATLLLRKIQVSSNSADLVSWATEDIRFSNLGTERSLSKQVADDLAALNEYFQNKLAAPKKSTFPIMSIPALDY
jgi:hypothetical protein